MKESGLQAKVLKLLKSFGRDTYFIKIIRANRSGVSDIVGWTSGLPWVLELKSPEYSATATTLQKYEQELAVAAGARALVSSSYTEIFTWLTKIQEESRLNPRFPSEDKRGLPAAKG